MHLEDQIKKSISEYPSLFLCKDYEQSKLRVLSFMFLTSSYEVEFAHTKNPKHGGYVTNSKYRKYRGEDVRVYDKPYGKEKYTGPDLNRVWNLDATLVEIRKGFGVDSEVVWLGFEEDFDKVKDNFYIANITVAEIESYHPDKCFVRKYTKHNHDEYIDSFRDKKNESNLKWSPSAFSKDISIYKDLDKQLFIQPDYKEACLFILNKALDYMNNKDNYNDYYKYMTVTWIDEIKNTYIDCIKSVESKPTSFDK